MKIAIIADSHFCQESRFDECQRIHRWIARDIAERGVDLVLHSGDVYERASTPREREAVAELVEDVTETAPLVVVRGNHDRFEDLLILERLATKHPVTVEEGARCHLVAGAMVACLAWPRKAQLLAATGDTGREASEQSAREALQHVLRGFGQTLAAHDGPRIVLSHAMVRGSKTSTGQPLVGADMEIGLEDLALAGADLYALGHIHLPQDWTINDASVIYPGSPRRTAYGEVEEKGYVIAEIDGHRVTWERVPTRATPMQLFELAWNPETGNFSGRDGARLERTVGVAGAEVRFRYHVDAEHRDAARAAAREWEEWLLRTAADVKVEECVRPKSTARAPEVALAQGLGPKLTAYWQARGTTPEPVRAERLLSMAGELEGEVRHAAA